jgi:hypothetical protein
MGEPNWRIDDPRTCVFINRPFDGAFTPLLHAIVFTITSCGFVPRSAIESGSGAAPRMERIVRAIEGSRYSIHDFSRCQGEGDANLARFNMPLELGTAMAQRFGRARKGRSHDWLLLVPAGHDYQHFVSDLAGYDPTPYDGTVETVVPAVMAWLTTRPDAAPTATTPHELLRVLPTFAREVEVLHERWRGHVTWTSLFGAALSVGTRAGLISRVAT